VRRETAAGADAGRRSASHPREDESVLEGLARHAGLSPIGVAALAGDVGRRRYFRLALEGGGSVIGVAYPPEEDDSRRRWNAARQALEPVTRVPALLAEDESAGVQIVEDFGTEDLAERFSAQPEQRGEWLARAAEGAARVASLDDPRLNPAFDAALFLRELDLAREAVFDMLLDSPLPAGARRAHDRWAEGLADEIAAHPYVLCHRDYHANNLFPVGGAAAMIDFQDLRPGPDAYDLASLLWERTTLSWMSPAIARRTVERFAAVRGADPEALSIRLDRVLLQRAWKVCGTFARAIACGRGDAYRRYLPPELALVRRLLAGTEASGGADGAFAAVLGDRAAALF
jgi:aminoglycoside/choline kinase family phosphotransferase